MQPVERVRESERPTIELDPFFVGTNGMLTEAYWYSGMTEEAVAQAQNLDETTRRYYEAMGRGDNDEAVDLIDSAVEAGLTITVARRYYAVAGNKEKSFDLLEAMRVTSRTACWPVAGLINEHSSVASSMHS